MLRSAVLLMKNRQLVGGLVLGVLAWGAGRNWFVHNFESDGRHYRPLVGGEYLRHSCNL